MPEHGKPGASFNYQRSKNLLQAVIRGQLTEELPQDAYSHNFKKDIPQTTYVVAKAPQPRTRGYVRNILVMVEELSICTRL